MIPVPAVASQMPSPVDIPIRLQGWCDLWNVGELAPEISVEISSRMTRSLGRCYPDRKLIRLARFVLEHSEDLFQEVLCHEAAHLAAYELHGRSIRPHGPEWKALIQMAGYPPSVRYKGVPLSRLPPTAHSRRPSKSILGSLRTELMSRVRALAFSKRL